MGLAAATGCIVEAVGDRMHVLGPPHDVCRAFSILAMLFPDAEEIVEMGSGDQDDMEILDVPEEKKPNLTDAVIESVDEELATFSFFGGSSSSSVADPNMLIVCGTDLEKRKSAVSKFKELQ